MVHWRERGEKVSLGDLATDNGVVGLIIYCGAGRAQYGGCFHSSQMPIGEAVRRWPLRWRLDRLPLRCSKCGSREVDVRADRPYKPTGPFNWVEVDRQREKRATELATELARYIHHLKPPKIG